MAEVNHPWQKGPKELIEHAIEHMHKDSDFDRRIAFLLLDVGVETLFKTFLTLPDEVTGTSMKFEERRQAAEGGFHKVVGGVKKASGASLKDYNLEHVQFYHEKRNTLYHDGNGITIPTEEVESYATLATKLLKTLLDVDLMFELNQPKMNAEIQKEVQRQEDDIKDRYKKIENALDIFYNNHILLVIERIAPRLVLPSFNNKFIQITERYLVDYVVEVGKNDEPIYGRKLPLDSFEYIEEILSLVENHIDDQALRQTLFNFDNLQEESKIKQTLKRLSSGGYFEVDDFFVSLLELSIEGTASWTNIFDLIYSLDYLMSNRGDDDRNTRYEKFIKESDEIILEIKKAESDIQAWLC